MRRLALAVGVLILMLMPASAGAAWKPAYNYGIDWYSSPFYNIDVSDAAEIGAYWQNTRDYDPAWYRYGWASDCFTNMGNLQLLNVVTHASTSRLIFRSSEWRTMSNGETTCLSCLEADVAHPLVYYHGVDNLQTGDPELRRCNHIRLLSNLNSTPLRIALYSGCNTAATPATGHYNVVERSRLEGVDCSVGFTDHVVFQSSPSIHTYQYDFHYGFWLGLYQGDVASEALEQGEARVLAYHPYYNGWHKGAIRGTNLGL